MRPLMELASVGIVDHAVELSEDVMDKDRIKGSAHEAKGAVKQGIGKATGDSKLETEGAAEKNAGKFQNAVGGVKDAAREALKK
jgi:uncharacterized protein YjbJ (UPF0337 family)